VTEIPEDLTVRMRDVRLAGYCVSGTRDWFMRHEINYDAFLKSGMNAREFVERGDAHALRVVESKLKRMGDGKE